MSFVQSPSTVDYVYQSSGNNNNNHNNATSASVIAVLVEHHHRIALKRKLEDYAGSTFDDDLNYVDHDDLSENEIGSSDLVSVNMWRDEHNFVHSSDGQENLTIDQHDSRVSDDQSVFNSSCIQSELTRNPSVLQFFVRMMPEGYNLVIKAYANDTVRALHEKIQSLTGIPVIEQRLTYIGKQLQWEQSLAECSIQNDAGLQLLGRLRSSKEPQHWRIIDDMVSMVCRLCRGELQSLTSDEINTLMSDYFTKISEEDIALATNQLQVFMSSSAPTALVMLYMSSIKGNKYFGECCIRHFLSLSGDTLPKPFRYRYLCGPILLEFCRLLRRVGHDDPLYVSCRSALGSLLESNGNLYPQDLTFSENKHGLIVVQEIFPFVTDLAKKLSRDLVSSMESGGVGPLASDVRDFTVFFIHLRATVTTRVGFKGPALVASDGRGYMHSLYGGELEYLCLVFIDLLCKMDNCLRRVEECLLEKGIGESDSVHSRWSQYLPVLKELNATSKFYPGAEEQFWMVLRDRKSSLCWLITKHVKRNDDHRWILEQKWLLDFECRRHLAMMMFPEVKEDFEELHEMLIDRSQILAESFDYIARAEPESLHAGLFMEFKNEEATGPGVLREWFFLVCQAIFNPQNALFVACPNDRRRFYPNTTSKVDPLHLEYFKFAGRVVALALMHKVQIGIAFDRVFFMQLAGYSLITLEDIRDADPCLYRSCKKILEMDPEFIDSDFLGLTFVREIEELGSRQVVELCSAGKSIVVNSKNREDYVALLIQNQFVISICEQVSNFAQGFADMLSKSEHQKFFFSSLEMEDLDRMLYGSEGAINVEDWKAHTEYNGYKETDTQILWFWKIVEEMSADQRRVLLFFWTSLKYLPVEGFCGLASRLYIYKSLESHDRLPSSHTCFYRLCFPPYPSMAMMQDRFNIITQEHVGTSFGTW